ncbi:spore protein [Priestia megaterium]
MANKQQKSQPKDKPETKTYGDPKKLNGPNQPST